MAGRTMTVSTALWLVLKSHAVFFLQWIRSWLFNDTKISARELDFSSIRYSQLWEDGRSLRRGLAVQAGEVVLSIAAAGDNTLGLLLDNPGQVVALDISPAQIALVSLKIHAIKHLNYEDFTLLLGFQLDDVIATSTNVASGRSRREIYRKLRPFLPEETRDFWDRNEAIVDSGIVDCGRLEGLHRIHRTCTMAFAHSQETTQQFFEQRNLKDQQTFFRDRWNTWQWRAVHRVIMSTVMLGTGRDPSLVKDTAIRNVSEYLLEKRIKCLNGVSISDNFYEEYMLLGNISGKHGLPDYLKRENYALLRQRVDRIQLMRVDIFQYLGDVAKTQLRFDAFNMSDLFEWFSPETSEELLRAIIRVSNPGARLAYWNLFNPRRRPDCLAARLEPQTDHGAEVYDRMFPYSDFVLEKVV